MEALSKIVLNARLLVDDDFHKIQGLVTVLKRYSTKF